MIWGVIVNAWFIPEIASQFFTMGLVIGIIGVVFRLNGMTVNTMAILYRRGANDDRPCLLWVSPKGFCCWSVMVKQVMPAC
ncbi:hypothetical protein OHD50_21815 [Escherichia coli]|nr:hypothetical protein [Escherichia coli]